MGAILYFKHDVSVLCTPASFNLRNIKEEVSNMIDADNEKRDDGTSIGPTLVRLAWHSSGTYSSKDKTGGSSGATMRFDPG